MNTSLLPKGRLFVRALIAKSVVGMGDENIFEFAKTRWASEALAREVTKAAVGALVSSDVGGVDAAREFFALARDQSVIGKLPLRRVGFNVRMLAVTGGSRGYWVGQASPKPLSRPTLQGSVLPMLKVASIVCATREMIRSADPAIEATLQDDLVRAVAGTIDEAFLDSANGGIAETMPASIAHGATRIASTSDFGADLRAMLAAFDGDLDTASFVTDATTAVTIATMSDSDGRYLFPGVGAKGGELLGLPLVTSRFKLSTSNGGVLILIDGNGVSAALGGFELDQSDAATLAMSDTPTSAPAIVSLWQTGTIAFKCEIFANWARQLTGSVVVLEGL